MTTKLACLVIGFSMFKQAPGLLLMHSRAGMTPARSDGTKPEIAIKISVNVNNY